MTELTAEAELARIKRQWSENGKKAGKSTSRAKKLAAQRNWKKALPKLRKRWKAAKIKRKEAKKENVPIA